MFAVIYLFNVKPGHSESFITAWKELTLLLRERCHGLGSRLHKSTENEYIAYAQWPDKASWEQAGSLLSTEVTTIRENLRASCLEVKTLYELDVVADLLLLPNAGN